MEKLQEAITTFDKWITPARQTRADAEYGNAKTSQSEQLRVIQDAADGNSTAADYLFTALKKIIARAFWKYYMGPDKHYHAARISAGDDIDFASMAYTMLMGGGTPSPFDTFKPSKFSASADLVKQFGYYVYRYLQNEAIKMIRSAKMGGMTGNVEHITGKKKEIPFVQVKGGTSLPGTDDDADRARDVNVSGFDDNTEEASAADSFTDDIELRETLRAFLKKLKQVKPAYHDVFLSRLKGASVEETAAALGISGQSVRNYIKAVKEMYDDFVGRK